MCTSGCFPGNWRCCRLSVEPFLSAGQSGESQDENPWRRQSSAWGGNLSGFLHSQREVSRPLLAHQSREIFHAYGKDILIEPVPHLCAGEKAAIPSWLDVADVTELAHVFLGEVFDGNDS